ncbi:pitrilysin family protein [Kitasatospora sp. NPDC086791]|uniref:M16 family metallopeptidase n=1 Tax=Kitasatospora sp. NPDC086791 TaxID=3155178 RepID=UPI003418647C
MTAPTPQPTRRSAAQSTHGAAALPTRLAAAQSTHRSAAQIARTARGPRPVPEVAGQQPYRMPPMLDTVLPNGLRVICVRQPSTSMTELRLRIPCLPRGPQALAAAEVMAATLLRGTTARDHRETDSVLARTGATLDAVRSPMWLNLIGSAPRDGLPALLRVLADALADARHAAAEVESAKGRLAERIRVVRSQPQVIAQEALRKHGYRDDPAVRDTPEPAVLAAVTAAEVAALHRSLLTPAGSSLVLVGDLDPERTVAEVAALTSWWQGGAAGREPVRVPLPGPGPVRLVDRPGAVQSQIRLVAPGPDRTDPDFGALSLANLVFGGYFSSRLVTNIRETKGYAYRTDSRFEDVKDTLRLAVEADSATGYTAAALREIRSELVRLTEGPLPEAEVESARRFLLGMSMISLASQATLATNLSSTLGFGLPPQWLTDFPEAVRTVRREEVEAAARRWFDPGAFTGVVVGDRTVLAPELAELGVVV